MCEKGWNKPKKNKMYSCWGGSKGRFLIWKILFQWARTFLPFPPTKSLKPWSWWPRQTQSQKLRKVDHGFCLNGSPTRKSRVATQRWWSDLKFNHPSAQFQSTLFLAWIWHCSDQTSSPNWPHAWFILVQPSRQEWLTWTLFLGGGGKHKNLGTGWHSSAHLYLLKMLKARRGVHLLMCIAGTQEKMSCSFAPVHTANFWKNTTVRQCHTSSVLSPVWHLRRV